MKVIQLRAENIKRLKAVDITPEGPTVVIRGKNAQGKTSVLDSIFLALGGRAALTETKMAVREGEDTAFVTLDLGEFTVTRTWKDGKTELRVTAKDGARYSSPQAFLDERLGQLSFDPLAFSNMDDAKQLAVLLDLVELPFDPADLERTRKTMYEDRTLIGREEQTLRGKIAGTERPTPEELAEPDDSIGDLMIQLSIAERQVQNRFEIEQMITSSRNRIFELREALAAEEENYNVLLLQLASVQAPVVDPDEIRASITTVGERNAARATRRALAELWAEWDDAVDRYANFTLGIEALDAEKEVALAQAKMPIPGLSFDDNGVRYQGIPFKQCSAAERLRVSVAMSMAMNPTIRVIRITDASLLDEDNMALIAEMATDNDYQVWLEVVGEDGVGFVVEDGEVVAINSAEAVAPTT